MTMNINRVSRLISLLLALAGIGLTLFLTWAHFSGSLRTICAPNSGCGTVLTSPYSTLVGLPTAFYGFVYYFTIALLVIAFPYFMDDVQDTLLSVTLGLNASAFIVSVLLTAYGIISLDTTCLYCLGSLALVSGLFGLSLFWKIRRVRIKSPEGPSQVLWKVGTVGFLLLFLLAGGLYYQSLSAATATQQTAETTALAADRTAVGNPAAPIRVVEFFDLGCPHCQEFTLNTFPKIRENYVKTGKVVWIFRDFPIQRAHPHALYAHTVLSILPPHQYVGAKKEIMRNASQWNARSNDSPRPYFKELMTRYGLGTREDPPKPLSRIILNRRRIITQLGIQATPSFLVNGKLYRGAIPYRRWQRIFDQILAQSS